MRRRSPSAAARPVHARPDATAGQGGSVAREVRRPAPGRDMRSGGWPIEFAEVAVGLGCDRRGLIIRQCRANRRRGASPRHRGWRRRRARPARRAPVLARGPAAPGAPARSSGGARELDAISQELREASSRLAAVTLEGEPGIGKTRLLLAAADLASANGFTCVAITADEEIRGPFLVARSLFASSAIRDTAAGTPAEAAVRRVVEAISGRDEPGFETLSPDAKLLRAFDLAGVAIAALARIRPAGAVHRRRPVGRRRHPAAPPLRRPE